MRAHTHTYTLTTFPSIREMTSEMHGDRWG